MVGASQRNWGPLPLRPRDLLGLESRWKTLINSPKPTGPGPRACVLSAGRWGCVGWDMNPGGWAGIWGASMWTGSGLCVLFTQL